MLLILLVPSTNDNPKQDRRLVRQVMTAKRAPGKKMALGNCDFAAHGCDFARLAAPCHRS